MRVTLLDRNKWNGLRHLAFDQEEIFRRREDGALQAVAALLHHDSLCPDEGLSLLDAFLAKFQKWSKIQTQFRSPDHCA